MQVVHQDDMREAIQILEASGELGEDLGRTMAAVPPGRLDRHALQATEGGVQDADGAIGNCFHVWLFVFIGRALPQIRNDHKKSLL